MRKTPARCRSFGAYSPIGEVRLIPSTSRKFSLSVDTFRSTGVNYDPRDNGGYLLTGDHGAIHLGATIFWRVRDPITYAFLADPMEKRQLRDIGSLPRVEQAIRRAFQRAAIHTCAKEDLKTIRITGKDHIRQLIEANMNDLLSSSGSMPFAVAIDTVEFNTNLPAGAQNAFDRAQRAQSQADQLIAEAEGRRANTIATAQQDAAQIIGSAKAAANELISQAIVRTKPITALSKANSSDRKTVLYRLWRDSIDRLFNKADSTMIVPDHDNLRVILPTTTSSSSKSAVEAQP
ncbi:MAG: hypothetical protein CSB34_04915 [Desulfobulbus propionicus]|nr:MAG: hypothetical protein CSB34_04915 [Desulfobulbus propionicus]